MKLGCHVGCNGKEMMVGSVKEAISYGANCFMFYTGAPQNTRRKAVEELRHLEAIELMESNGMNYCDVVVHAPYIINLANTIKPETFEIATEFLKKEIDRCDYIKAKTLVLHPGSHVKAGTDLGIQKIIEGLNQVLTEEQEVIVALETMSGKGTECGRSFEEIRQIIDGVKLNHKLGVCLDTCHISDAGYDLSDFDAILDDFDNIIGLDRLKVIHLNDSKNPMGASKDRHENIGFGHIGFDKLHSVVTNQRIADVPKILETPYVTKSDDEKKRELPPYKYEITALKDGVFSEDMIEKIRSKA